jgi:hypothetical protein
MNPDLAVRSHFDPDSAAGPTDPEKLNSFRFDVRDMALGQSYTTNFVRSQDLNGRREAGRFPAAEHPGHHTRERVRVANPDCSW